MLSFVNQMEKKAEVLQGTLDFMVLQTLASIGPMHGYDIAARFEQISNGAIQLNMGTLYPALVRLEERGHIAGTWNLTEKNRRARFYDITAAGRRQLVKERPNWLRTAAMMTRLLDEGAQS